MGKKLDALLGRSFKTARFKATVALALSRLAVIRNQRQARCSIARSDVVELLKTHDYERALYRVEQVIKEQNMLDVLLLLDGYCHLFLERINLIQHEKVCPEELHEAVASLIYASTRCGDFPELQEIRSIFALRFGREFAARAVELRNNCGVNPKVIQKLSTRTPSLESKTRMLKEIASENNIDIHLPDDNTVEYTESGSEEKQRIGSLSSSVFTHQGENQTIHPFDEIDTSVRRKYKDVADAAQAAFESAAYAAAAARVAVEMSRSKPAGPTDDPYSPGDEDVIVITEADDSIGENVRGVEEIALDDDGDGIKRVDENDRSRFDAKEMDDIKVPLNINRRPISVRTVRTR